MRGIMLSGLTFLVAAGCQEQVHVEAPNTARSTLSVIEDVLCEAGSVIGTKKVTVSGDSLIVGAVASNDKIDLTGGSTIVGSATAPEVKTSGGAEVQGVTTEADPALEQPDVEALIESVCEGHVNGPIPLTDDGEEAVDDDELKLSGGDAVTLPPGTYCFDKVTASGGSTFRIDGTVELFVYDRFTGSGGSVVGDGTLLVAAGGDAKLSGGSGSVRAGYLAGGKVEASGASSAAETLIYAEEVVVSGDSQINAGGFCDPGTTPPEEPPPPAG